MDEDGRKIERRNGREGKENKYLLDENRRRGRIKVKRKCTYRKSTGAVEYFS